MSKGRTVWLVVIAVVGYYGCTEWRWSTVYAANSPDGALLVKVQKTACFPDCAVRVVLRDRWRSRTIASASDCVISFAYAAWSGAVVAVFVDGRSCGQMKAAYDVKRRAHIAFESAEDGVRRGIIADYAVQPDELAKSRGDPLIWATYDQFAPTRASVEFRRRYEGKH